MILCLDLGTKCGWAVDEKQNGVWNLKPSTHESAGQRYVKFQEELAHVHMRNRLSMVLYEEVHMHRAVDAAHVYGGLMAILQTFCIRHRIEYRGVGVGTIKKFATGNGAAKKDAMIAAAIKLFPSVNVIDDNHADALCLLYWANQNIIQ